MKEICATCGRVDEGPRHVCVKPFTFDATYYPSARSVAVPVTPAPVIGCAFCDVDPESSPSVRVAVRWLEKVARLLLTKNRRYGNSATAPLRVFSKSDATEGLKVRIDDKLSRIQAGAADEDEDVLLDLVGYLAFLATQQK